MTGGLALWHFAGTLWAPFLAFCFAPFLGYAILRGDRTTRELGYVGAVMILLNIALLAEFSTARPSGHSSATFDPDLGGVDLLLLGLLVALSLRTRRYYPLFLAAAQVLVVITHCLSEFGLLPDPQITALLLAAPTALLILGCTYTAARPNSERETTARA